MSIKNYFQKLNNKSEEIGKKAKNPFLERDFAYNPFTSAIEQTYIWVESKNARHYNDWQTIF